MRDSNFSPASIRAPFAKSAPEIAFRFSGCSRIISSKPPSPHMTAKKLLEVTVELGLNCRLDNSHSPSVLPGGEGQPPPNSFRPSQARPTDVLSILQTTPQTFTAV